jgi:predicted HicB family RNase H-like nuclease
VSTDPLHYSYRVRFVPEVGRHLATVLEFPSHRTVEDCPTRAIEAAVELVRAAVDEMVAAGVEPPVPYPLRHYSGRILFRTDPELHRWLAIEAAHVGESLNATLNRRLRAPMPAAPYG